MTDSPDSPPPGQQASTTGRTGVAILARRAQLGHGKSRLARTLGAEATLAIYRELIRACAKTVRASGLPACVYFDPAPGDADVWPASEFAYGKQTASPDLGRRLRDVAAAGLARFGAGVLLIGTDCPYLDADTLRQAAGALWDHDAVLGPSLDGGYYLLGLRELHAPLFEGIAWSTAAVAEQTRAVLAKAGLTCSELPALGDIDEAPDWERYVAWRAAQSP